MFKDAYFFRARLFPALLTSIPLLIFANKILGVKYAEALRNVLDILPLITHLGLSAALVFLLVQVNRLVAKEIFQRWFFQDDLHMPTTNHLLWSDNYYPPNIKNKIRDKIIFKFQIDLASNTEEQQDEPSARKLIVAGVAQIKNSLRGNQMLYRHNIEYGFWRNLVGGSLLSILFSLIIFSYGYYNKVDDLAIIGIICLIVYSIPVILSKIIIGSYGVYYAKILYEQFLSQ